MSMFRDRRMLEKSEIVFLSHVHVTQNTNPNPCGVQARYEAVICRRQNNASGWTSRNFTNGGSKRAKPE
jgi:hypothetical protein